MSPSSRTFPADLCNQPQPRAPHWPRSVTQFPGSAVLQRLQWGTELVLPENWGCPRTTGQPKNFLHQACRSTPFLPGSLSKTILSFCSCEALFPWIHTLEWRQLELLSHSMCLKHAADKGKGCLPSFPRPFPFCPFYFYPPLSFLAHFSPPTFQNFPFLSTSYHMLSQCQGLTLTLFISGFQGSSLGLLVSSTILLAWKTRTHISMPLRFPDHIHSRGQVVHLFFSPWGLLCPSPSTSLKSPLSLFWQ